MTALLPSTTPILKRPFYKGKRQSVRIFFWSSVHEKQSLSYMHESAIQKQDIFNAAKGQRSSNGVL